jgi:O-antigen/teichoic acid export membrane protein
MSFEYQSSNSSLGQRLTGRTFGRQFFALMTGHVSIAVASFASLAFLARSVSVGEFGRVIFAQAVATSLFIFLDPSLEDGLLRFVPLVVKRGQRGDATALFERVLLIDGLVGCLFALLGITILWAGAIPLGQIGNPDFLMLALLQGGLQAAQGTAGAAFSLTNGLVQWGFLRASASAFTTATAVLALLLGGEAVWYMAALSLASGVSTVTFGVLAARRMRKHWGPPRKLPADWIGQFVRFSLLASITTSVSIGTESLPLSIIGLVGGPIMIGIFRIGLAPARLTTTAFSPLPTIFFPLLSRDAAEDEYEKIKRKVLGWTRLAIPIGAVLAVLAWVLLPVAVPLIFGPDFESAVQPARVLVLAALVRSSIAWSRVFPLSVGRPGVGLFVTTIDACLLVAATFWLAKTGTVTTVAFAYLGIAILVTLVWIWIAKSLTAPNQHRALSQAGRR